MDKNENLISIEIAPKKNISILASSLLILMLALILWKQQGIDYAILIKFFNYGFKQEYNNQNI